MKRMSDGRVTVTAIQYFQMDRREGAEYMGILVLKRQVRYMERIRRLEEYLNLLLRTVHVHTERAAQQADQYAPESEPTWERIEVLDNRFTAAEDALHAHERTQP